MDWLIDLSTSQLYVFALVLARVGGMVIVAPLYSSVAAPWQVRALLAIALAALITPVQHGTNGTMPAAPAECLVALAVEFGLGVALGLGVTIVLAAAELAGQLVAQVSGLALAEVLDPEHDAGLPAMAKLMSLFTVAIYLLVGGHRWLVAGLLGTFNAIPPGAGRFHDGLYESLLALMGESFSLALSAVAPVLIAVILATLILGMIGRTLPQLNILSVGFGLNTMIALAALALTFGSMAWLFENELRPAISLMLRALAAQAPLDLRLWSIMPEVTSDKTHDPTPHRRQQAREQGHVARSRELTSAALLLGGVVALVWLGRPLVDFVGRFTVRQLGGEPWLAADVEFVVGTWNGLLTSLSGVLLPVVGLLMLVGIGANVVQAGLIFMPQKLVPDFSRVNPVEGFARLFSARNFTRMAVGMAKLAVVAAVATYSVNAQRDKILNCGQLPSAALAAFMCETLIWTSLEIGLALLAVAALDYGWERLRHERDLRMTTEELREEMRNLRGDPQLIARCRALARRFRAPRLASSVAQADVVITGPGGLAVAIRYDAEALAPAVVAKGLGAPGERIRELAVGHQVPLAEQQTLAASLYDVVDVNNPVPPELFAAVAEILAKISPA